MDAIFSRNSVRKFTEEMPSEEQIERLLRAAMAAPSAKNQQPWEFFVVTNKDCLQKLSEATPYSMCVKSAQAAFVLASRRDGIIAPEFRDIDMAIASENILLELEALGLGGVMIGVSPIKENMEHVRDALKMKDELVPFTIIPFGYPEKRRPLEDRYDVSRIHYVK